MSSETSYETIIIGGGKAGKTLSMDLGNHGRRVALIERDRQMIGGGCINLACIPTKTFVQSAKVAFSAQHAGEYGIETGKVRVDWMAVRRRVEGVVESLRAMNYKAITAAPASELMIATARFLDGKTVETRDDEGQVRVLTGENIFINTGTRPASTVIPGLDASAILDSTSVQRLDTLPAHLIVIGGGYIALEFAQMFRRFGSEVTVLVRGTQILPREDADVAEAVATLLRAEGIQILTQTSTVRGDRTTEGVSLTVQTPDGKQTLAGTHLLAAIGRTPNTESLNLEAAGVKADKHGYIVVNERLETSAPTIWALGDCNGGPQYTHASLDDYRIVKANVFGPGGRSTKDRFMPSALYIEPELGRVGLTESEARAQGISIRIARVPAAVIPRARTSGYTIGQLKAVVDAGTQRILGCSILAENAGEMISTVQMAMIAGLPYTSLRDAVLSHPTMTEGLNNLFAESSFKA